MKHTFAIKHIIRLSALAVAALSLNTACSSDDLEQNIPSDLAGSDVRVAGMPMKFAVGEKQSRTAYYVSDSEDDRVFRDGLGIKWINGDNVLVFCDQAKGTKKQSKYDIIDILPNGTSAKMTANGEELVFDDNANTQHNIHAIYPGDATKVSDYKDGVVKLKLNQSRSTAWDAKNSDNRYIVPFDMSDLYMVATKNNQKRAAQVDLAFAPIMSTARVILSNQQSDVVKVSGVTITHRNTKGYVKDGCIQYDYNTGKLVAFADADRNENVSFNIDLSNGYQNQFLSLGSHELLDFTFFLPPFDDISAENPLQIYVRATEGYSRNIEVTELNPATKKRIQIAMGKKDADEWIKYIDDDVYVSQLSIPGAAWVGTVTNATGTNGNGYFGGSALQGYRTEGLWNLGVRAFDFHGNNGMVAYQNGGAYDENIFNVLDQLNAKLAASPKEFAILFVRQEAGVTTGQWDNLKREYWTGKYSSRSIAFRPDLTVGEMRGKILVIVLDWGSNTNRTPMLSGKITTENWPNKYSEITCYNEQVIKENCRIDGKDGHVGTMYTQEYLNAGHNYQEKINLACQLLDKTHEFNKNPSQKNVWAFNAIYACRPGGWTTANFAAFQKAIWDVNEPARGYGKYNTDNLYSYFLKSVNWGPAGIVMQIFNGKNVVQCVGTDYYPMGDILTQSIIDRNFANKLLKK